MEPLGAVLDQLKGFPKSGHDFVVALFHHRHDSARRNPIEILKRLQREVFSDLMKLRDRQEKVERLLSFYKSSKGGPFQEETTHVRGQVDFLGALLVMNDLNQQNLDAVNRAGIRTGVDSRFIFETNIRQKDTLAVEFVASQKGKEHHGDFLEMPLVLAKLNFTANVNDWLSVMAIPIGAQCKDFAVTSNSFDQLGKGLLEISSLGPPLLKQHNGSAIGISVRKSNVIASLAQYVSGLGMRFGCNKMNSSGTFAQIMYHFPSGTKLSLLGLHQVPLSSRTLGKWGALAIPFLSSKQHEVSEAVPEAVPEALPLIAAKTGVSAGSIALMVESEIDDHTKIGGWVNMNKLNPESVQWAVTMSDDSKDSFGWGVSLGGLIGDSASGDHFQAESYIKFNMGGKFCLKPGLAYVIDGNSKIAALMIRSDWSL